MGSTAWRLGLCLGVMGCQVSSFDAYGKLCTAPEVCPAPLSCVALAPGGPTSCRYVAEFQDGVSEDGGYAGTRDAYASQSLPTTNFGTGPEDDFDGNDPSGTFHHNISFLSWDVSALPPTTKVLAASITLDVTNGTLAGAYSIYGLKRPWVETQVTWNQAAINRPWAQAGAAASQDRGALVGSLEPMTPGFFRVDLQPAGVTLVNSWLTDIATNAGLVIEGSFSDGVDFDSRRSSYALQHPRLELVY